MGDNNMKGVNCPKCATTETVDRKTCTATTRGASGRLLSRYLMFFSCLCLLFENSRQQEQQQDADKVDYYATLVKWVLDHGGIVDNRIRFSTIHSSNNDGGGTEPQQQHARYRGMVATEDIPEKTVLVGCPFELILGLKEPTVSMCHTMPIIERELRLGNESFWYPYLSLLQQNLNQDDSNDSASSCRLPMLWNSVALHELHHHVFPPSIRDSTRFLPWAEETCDYPVAKPKRRGGNNNKGEIIVREDIDPVRLQSVVMDITRACDRGLVPIYDLFNHHNGELNTYLKIDFENERFLVYANQFIPKGKELYVSYGAHWSPKFFADYGFIEPWPQVWHWDTTNTNDRGEKIMHGFMMLPPPPSDDDNNPNPVAGTIAIEISEELIADIGRRYIPLSEYRERTFTHNMHAIGEGTIINFQRAAERLLYDQSGVTSIEDDENYLVILRGRIQNSKTNHKKEKSSRDSNNEEATTLPTTNDDITFLKDIMCAVEYRLEFKKNVKKALRAAQEILEIRNKFHNTEL